MADNTEKPKEFREESAPIRILWLAEDAATETVLRTRLDGWVRSKITRPLETPAELPEALAKDRWDLLLFAGSRCSPHLQALFQALRPLPPKHRPPVLVLGRERGEEAAVAAMRLGAWDYLPWENPERWQEALDAFQAPAERPTVESAACLDPQALLRLIEAQSGGVVYVLHPPSKHPYCVGSCASLIGQERPSMTYEDWCSRIHPEDRDLTPNFESLLKGTPGLYRYEYRVRHEDRYYFQIEDTVIVHASDAPGGMSILGMCGDISARHQAMLTLESTERVYSAIFANTSSALCVIDEKDRLLQCNPEFEHLAEENRMRIQIERVWTDFVHQEDRERIAQVISRRLTTSNAPQRRHEFRFVTATGRERHVLASIGRIPDSTHLIVSLLDVSEQKIAQQQMAASQARLTNILQWLPDATMVIDTDGRVIAWNKAMEKVSGVAASEMIGKGDYAYAIPFYGQRRPILIDLALLPDDEIERNYAKISRSGDVVYGEAVMLNIPNQSSYLTATASKVRDAQGRVIGAIESIRDATDRRNAEVALQASEERLQLALKGADLGFWDWEFPENRVVVNERLAEMLDMPPQRLSLSLVELTERVHPEDLPKLRERMAEHVRKRVAMMQQEARFAMSDGSWRWILVRGRIVSRDDRGLARRAAGTFLDITEHRETEQRARANAERTAFMLDLFRNAESEGSADELYDYIVDRAAELTHSAFAFFNEVDKELGPSRIGSRSAFLRRTMPASAGRPPLPFSEDGRWAECLRIQAPFILNGDEEDLDLGLPGELPRIRRFLSVAVFEHEQARLVLAVANKSEDYGEFDATQLQLIANELYKIILRRRAEQTLRQYQNELEKLVSERTAALRESERKFRSLVETMNDWIWEVDSSGRYTYSSPQVQNILGYSKEEILGMTPWDFLPESDPVRLRRGSGQLLPNIVLDRSETTLVHRDGSTVVLETSAIPLIDERGNLTGYRGLALPPKKRSSCDERFVW